MAIQPSYINHKESAQSGISPWLILVSIILLGIFLRFYRLGDTGSDYLMGNSYYAAAVKSMIQSPYNFWYAVAEPGGSVTVDKPPLGLWFQGISALLFGFNSLSLALPQAMAGVLCIGLMYTIVRHQFGEAPGLLAAFVYAITPVSVALDRTNTLDSILILFLLLATLAFTKAVQKKNWGWLVLGGVFIGLGFNVKMLQAFLSLPALYLFYLFGAKHQWWKKILHLAVTTFVVLITSLSWALAVDLTPPENRPYVGGSLTNSVIDLTIGYNGATRLFGGLIPAPDLHFADGTNIIRTQSGSFFYPEVGKPGYLRLFTQPLVGDVSWLLPMALLAGLASLFMARPFSEESSALVMWECWLLTCVIFFSVSGMMHAYYVLILGPPAAALTGIGLSRLVAQAHQHKNLYTAALIISGIATLAFQVFVVNAYIELRQSLIPTMILVGAAGIVLLLAGTFRQEVPRVTYSGATLLVISLLAAPLVWSILTTFDPHPNPVLPRAGLGPVKKFDTSLSLSLGPTEDYIAISSIIADYLQPRTEDTEYLLGTWIAFEASPYILETGRPAMIIGGFTGVDPVMTMSDVIKSVEDGSQRYFLFTDLNNMRFWFDMNCKPIDFSEIEQETGSTIPPLPSNLDMLTLYDCKPEG